MSILFMKSGDRCSPVISSHRESLIVLGSGTASAQKSLALELSVCGSFCSCLQAEVKESESREECGERGTGEKKEVKEGKKEKERKESFFMCLRWPFIVTFIAASASSPGRTHRPAAIPHQIALTLACLPSSSY